MRWIISVLETDVPFIRNSQYDTCLGINIANLIYNESGKSYFATLELFYGNWEFDIDGIDGGETSPFIHYLVNKRKVPLEHLRMLSNEQAREIEDEVLTEGRRVLVYIDEYFAPWSIGKYLIEHNSHAAILVGKQRKYAHIVDGWHGRSKYVFENYEKARNSSFVQNKMLFFTKPIKYEPTIDSFHFFIQKSNSNMNSTSMNQGLEAMSTLSNMIASGHVFDKRWFISLVHSRIGMFTFIEHACMKYGFATDEIIDLLNRLRNLWKYLPAFVHSAMANEKYIYRKRASEVLMQIKSNEVLLLDQLSKTHPVK